MTISGSKSVKKSQKFLKKPKISFIPCFSKKKKIVVANLININSYNMKIKSVMLLYKF